MQVATIGLDLAKHVFQIHGIDAAEKVVVRKQLRRSQVMGFFEALRPLSVPFREVTICAPVTNVTVLG
jgi:transposase